MPAVVINMEAALVDNAILLDYSTSKVALEEPKIGSTDPNIATNNNCTDDKLHLEMPRGNGNNQDDGDKSNERDAIPTASQQQLAASELEWFELGTIEAEGYECEDGDDEDLDEEEEASQADDGSMNKV